MSNYLGRAVTIPFLNHLIVFNSASLIEYRKDFMPFST